MKICRERVFHVALLAVTLIVGVALGMVQITPPRINPNSPHYAAFQRALGNIERLSVTRPTGSDGLVWTRDEIVAELVSMGVTPVVESRQFTKIENMEITLRNVGYTPEEWWEQNRDYMAQFGIYRPQDSFGRHIFGGNEYVDIHNILVRLEAPGAQGGVMFLAHYDSWSVGYGVGDNMQGVVALIEAIRSQAQNSSRKNNLYFLFTDGHESGLALGSQMFLESRPDFEIDLVIEVDGGHTLGTALNDNARSLRTAQIFRRAVAHPLGFSITPDLTHSSGFGWGYGGIVSGCHAPFFRAGYDAVSFSAIGRRDIRHTPRDTLDSLNKPAAWHKLITVLSAADYFAGNTLPERVDGHVRAVYFPFLPGVLIVMRQSLSVVLGIAACVLALAYMIVRLMQDELRVSFVNILFGLVFLVTVWSLLFLPSGSYLAFIPLMGMSATALLKNHPIAHAAARALTIFVSLLIWVPLLYLFFTNVVWFGMGQGWYI